MAVTGLPGTSEAVEGFDTAHLNEIKETLAYRERYQGELALESLEGPSVAPRMSSEEARSFVSDKAYEMIVRYETGGRSYYEKVYKSAPCWPEYASGLTIGFGFDLGYHSEDEFIDAWGKLLPAHDVERLKEGIGVKGSDARDIARRMKDIRVSWEVSETVFQRHTLPKYVGQTQRALSNFDLSLLHPHATGALVSLVFNRGPDFRSSADKRREMRNIRDQMSRERFGDIPDEFRSMKRLWSSKGLQSRREEEADLFDEGLHLKLAPPVIAQPAPRPAQQPAAVPRPDPVPQPPPVASGGMPPLVLPPAIDHLAGPSTTVADAGPAAAPASANSESIAGARAQPGLPTEDDWDAFDALPVESIERPSVLEGTRGSFGVEDVRWAPDDIQIPDYRHVAGATAGGAFTFAVEDLELLIAANRFRPTGDHGKVLFGLRGCQLAGNANEQIGQPALKLQIARPNHRNFRCTIGVLDLKARTISGFIASTVPNRGSVYEGWRRKQNGESNFGNMLPTGCYGYVCGPHIGTSTHVNSAFLLRESANKKRKVAVYRSFDDVTYTTEDEFDVCEPGDNIHPAFRAGSADFSSVGCQTIRGTGSFDDHSGEWKAFRLAAGLAPGSSSDHGKAYSYVLLTGLEAKLASELRASGEAQDQAKLTEKLARLRQGSMGDEVKALQQALGLQPTGVFAAVEAESLAEWQAGRLGYRDGIYALEYDAHFQRNILGTTQPVAIAAATGRGSAGTGIESILGGSARGRPRASASGLLGSSAAQAQIRALLEAEDRELIERLAIVTEQVASDPRRAGDLALATNHAAVPESLSGGITAIGDRVYARLEGELFRLVCGSQGDDNRDRDAIVKALTEASSKTGVEKAPVVAAAASLLLSTGLVWYAPALIVAAIFARRIARTTLEETCQVWGESRRSSDGDARRRGMTA